MPLQIPDSSLKRRRVEDSLVPKGKLRFEGDWTEFMDEYEDEMNCPMSVYLDYLFFHSRRILYQML